jgi:hypothetical protein
MSSQDVLRIAAGVLGVLQVEEPLVQALRRQGDSAADLGLLTAGNVGAENGGELAVKAFLLHAPPPWIEGLANSG